MIRSLQLRITLIKPPPDVPFCLQKGKDDLVPPSSDSGEIVSFDFTVNITNDRIDGPPKFRGPFVQGPPAGRFIYINSGTYAGQADSCWSRRAKIPLSGITWELTADQVRREADLGRKSGLTTRHGDRFPSLSDGETLIDYICRGVLAVYEMERAHLGSHSAAANRLGMNRTTLYDWLEWARQHGSKVSFRQQRMISWNNHALLILLANSVSAA